MVTAHTERTPAEVTFTCDGCDSAVTVAMRPGALPLGWWTLLTRTSYAEGELGEVAVFHACSRCGVAIGRGQSPVE